MRSVRKILTSLTVNLCAALVACQDGGPAGTGLRPDQVSLAKGASPDMSTSVAVPNSPTAGLRGDGKYLDGSGMSVYAHGVCGVQSLIYIGNGGGDAVMNTRNPKFSDRKCKDYPRTVFVTGETNAAVTVMLYVASLHQPGAEIPIGQSAERSFSINPGSGPCGRYSFDGTEGADLVVVTRTSATTWLVQTKPAPENRARCVSDGSGPYNMDVSLTVQGQ